MKLLTATLAAFTLTQALSGAPASATPPPPPRTATDCAAKVYVIDDLVCSKPELLALDRRVGEAAAATPDGANPEWPRMVEGQQGWYWRSRQCWKQPAARQAACLTEAYETRLAELAILAAPPPPEAGERLHCQGPPWAEGRVAMLNRTAGDALTLSAPSGQVLLIAFRPGSQGWAPFVTRPSDHAPLRFEHHNGAAFLECRPRPAS